MDETVIAAMREAVDSDPGNAALRAHLAGLLLDAGKPDEAWEHASETLRTDPANPTLLELAARAGEQSGHTAEAAGYRTLLHALGTPTEPPTATEPPQQESAAPTAPPWHSQADDNTDTGSEEPVTDLTDHDCLLYTSPSPRDQRGSRMPSSA